MTHSAITWETGWYYDPLHQQPVYLFLRNKEWWGRFVWQETPSSAMDMLGKPVTTHDMLVTATMYDRLIPMHRRGSTDYISQAGSALRDTYGLRPLVQVKLAFDGHGVCIQTPSREIGSQPDPQCDAVWLADDEIPTIIRALQARRRAVLDPDITAKDPRRNEE